VDDIFLRFARAMIAVMMLYGTGMILVLLFGDYALGARMISAFSSMFVAVLGFGSGYILGKLSKNNGKNGTNGINGKGASHDSS
jgi:hypothetical protein